MNEFEIHEIIRPYEFETDNVLFNMYMYYGTDILNNFYLISADEMGNIKRLFQFTTFGIRVKLEKIEFLPMSIKMFRDAVISSDEYSLVTFKSPRSYVNHKMAALVYCHIHDLIPIIDIHFNGHSHERFFVANEKRF